MAESNPDAIFKEVIDISVGVTDEQAARMAKNLQFTEGDQGKVAAEQFKKLYELFVKVRSSADANIMACNGISAVCPAG